MRQRKTKRALERIAYSPSGRLLIGRDGHNEIQVWDARTLEQVAFFPAGDPREKLFDCLFRPGGLRFLQEQGYVSAEHDLPTQAPRPEHQRALPSLEKWAYGFAWSAASHQRYPRHFACFGCDGQTFVGWHPAVRDAGEGLWRFDRRLVRRFGWMADWTVNDMALSADGRFLAAATFSSLAGYEMALVDLRGDSPPRGVLYHTHDVVKVVWSPAAPLVACVATRSVWLWDAPAMIGLIAQSDGPGNAPPVQPLHLFKGFRTTVEGLCFSPDGSLLVGGAREGRIGVWEVALGRQKAALDWKSGKVHDVAFSPDGCTIAAACSKGVVVWDAE
jgi:WD40 repeat protein